MLKNIRATDDEEEVECNLDKPGAESPFLAADVTQAGARPARMSSSTEKNSPFLPVAAIVRFCQIDRQKKLKNLLRLSLQAVRSDSLRPGKPGTCCQGSS